MDNPLKVKDYLFAKLHSIVNHVDRAKLTEKPIETEKSTQEKKDNTPKDNADEKNDARRLL